MRVEQINGNGLYGLDISINKWIKANSKRYDIIDIKFDNNRAYIIYREKGEV